MPLKQSPKETSQKWGIEHRYQERPRGLTVTPVRPGLLRRSPGLGGGGGRGLRDPDAKNQSYHQRIEMKFCVSHYSYKSMPDAKFDLDTFSSFGDMTSQTFLLKKGMSHRIRIFPPPPGKWG